MNYKQMSDKLDKVIDQLQNGNIELDETIQRYEEASKIIKKMQKYLNESENKIKKIKADLAKAD